MPDSGDPEEPRGLLRRGHVGARLALDDLPGRGRHEEVRDAADTRGPRPLPFGVDPGRASDRLRHLEAGPDVVHPDDEVRLVALSLEVVGEGDVAGEGGPARAAPRRDVDDEAAVRPAAED